MAGRRASISTGICRILRPISIRSTLGPRRFSEHADSSREVRGRCKVMAHYGFAIDTVRCIGCHTCSTACKLSNNLPIDIWWNRVLTEGGEAMDTPGGEWPQQSHAIFTCFLPALRKPRVREGVPRGRHLQGPGDGRRAAGLRQVHRLPHVHGGLPLHGRAVVQLGGAGVPYRPCGRRHEQSFPSKARGREMHNVLAEACSWGRTCLRQRMPCHCSLLGRSGRLGFRGVEAHSRP